MKILLWNIRSFNSNKSDLLNLMAIHDPEVILLCETWLKPDSKIAINRYNGIFDSCPNGKDGIAVLIKKGISYRKLPFSNTVLSKNRAQFLGVALGSLSVVVAYITPDCNFNRGDWEDVFKEITPPFIVCGDMNAHHCAWGSDNVNIRGRELYDTILDNDICVINDRKSTRLSLNSKSVIDLVITSSNLSIDFSATTLDDCCGSDHFPIVVSNEHNNNNPTFMKSRRVFKKEKWCQFEYNISLKLMNISHPISYSSFIEVIKDTLNEVFPVENIYFNKPICPWWDSECSEMIKGRRKAIKKFREDGLITSFIEAKKHIARCKKFLKQKKIQKFREFCDSLNRTSKISEVWKSVKRFAGAFSLPRSDNEKNYNSEWVQVFLDKLSPPSVKNQPTFRLEERYELNWLADPISMDELKKAIMYNKNSAPGRDGITYEIIYNLPKCGHTVLLELFNEFLREGRIPEDWREFQIRPIIKKGGTIGNPSSYRPIALASCLRKIMEKIIKSRLNWWAEKHRVIPNCQSAFRTGGSTHLNITRLVTEVMIGFSTQQHTIAVFLDIKSAYDHVVPEILCQKLATWGLPVKLINFIYTLLSDRRIYVKKDGQDIGPRVCNVGLPQGSVLSPLLFNLYLADITEVVDVDVLQFADDICLYHTGRNITNSELLMNRNLRALSEWLKSLGLELSPAKTTAMSFASRKTPKVNLVVNSEAIRLVDDFLFLGVILDRRLTWKPQVEALSRKCWKVLDILKAVAHIGWGSDPKTMMMLYRALIRSRIDYGSIPLNNCSKKLYLMLDRIQYAALRVSLGCMKSTPTAALQLEAVEAPLFIRRRWLLEKFILKQMLYENNPFIERLKYLRSVSCRSKFWENRCVPEIILSYNKISKYHKEIKKVSVAPQFMSDFNSCVKEMPIVDNIGIDKTCNERPNVCNNIEFMEKVQSLWPSHVLIFTDGSKSSVPNRVAFSVVVPTRNINVSIRINDLCSIYTAELLAIYHALSLIRDGSISRAVIFSDSQSAIRGLKSNHSNGNIHPLLFKIRESVSSLNNHHVEVCICWIPSHVGIMGNELADGLAKKGLTMAGVNPQYKFCFINDLFPVLKAKTNCIWKYFWRINCKMKGKFYRTVQNEVPRVPWYHNLEFTSRKDIVKIIRLRMGHCKIPIHLFRIGVANSNLCECGSVGTANHIFFECPNNKQNIDILYSNLIRNNINVPLNISTVLHDINNTMFLILTSFLKHSNIDL